MEDLVIDFVNSEAAEKALAAEGFSVGTLQRDAPRGVIFGDIPIMKWRYLSRADKSALHATLERRGIGRDVPCVVRINPKAPFPIKNLLRRTRDHAEPSND